LTLYLEGPPENDDFANAVQFSGIPFDHSVDTMAASLETAEPTPSCAQGESFDKSVWYAYAPTEAGSLTAHVDAWFSTALAVYTGSSVDQLTQIDSRCWGDWLTFQAEAGTTYYLQVGGMWGDSGSLRFYLQVTPPPEADFWFDPYEPSVFDTVWFHNWSYDPAQVGIESVLWDFGDGTTSTEWYPSHQYAVDGDYTVEFTVTTYDGRSASTARDVQVRTHDVAITKFTVPNAAKAGQTRSIVVGLNSRRYPEQVEVELFRSVPGDYDAYEWVGSLTQEVPVRPMNRTTDFKFSYTFTSDDANVGKVTFKAEAHIWDARDAFPADNEAISLPTKVNP
jgi:PKD repeat protein